MRNIVHLWGVTYILPNEGFIVGHILSSRLKHKAFFFLTHMYFQQFKEKKVVPSQEAVENMALMSVSFM